VRAINKINRGFIPRLIFMLLISLFVPCFGLLLESVAEMMWFKQISLLALFVPCSKWLIDVKVCWL
jgi:hypothetical protein